MGTLKERLVWLPAYVLGCAAVGILAYFATYSNLKVGLVTAALGAAFGALGWLAMQILQRPRRITVFADQLDRLEQQIEATIRAVQAREAYLRDALDEAEKAIGSANFVIINRHNKMTQEWEEYAVAAEEDIGRGLAAIRKAQGR